MFPEGSSYFDYRFMVRREAVGPMAAIRGAHFSTISYRSFGWSCVILADLGRSWQILSVFLSVHKRNVVCKHRSKKGVPNQQSNKNGINIAQKWNQSGPGRWQGGPTNQQKYKNITKTQTQSTKMRRTKQCPASPSKIGGLNGWAFTDGL